MKGNEIKRFEEIEKINKQNDVKLRKERKKNYKKFQEEMIESKRIKVKIAKRLFLSLRGEHKSDDASKNRSFNCFL